MGEDRTGRCRGGCWGRGRDTEKEREEKWLRRNGEAAAAGPGLEAVIRQTHLYMSVCPCSSLVTSAGLLVTGLTSWHRIVLSVSTVKVGKLSSFQTSRRILSLHFSLQQRMSGTKLASPRRTARPRQPSHTCTAQVTTLLTPGTIRQVATFWSASSHCRRSSVMTMVTSPHLARVRVSAE